MDKIQVTARFTLQGKIIPTEFISDEVAIAVHDIGRQWEDEAGKHILVMDAQHNTYHLLFKRDEFTWYRVRDISSPPMPS